MNRMGTHVPLPDLLAVDPDFEVRVRESYGRQNAMKTIGATLASVEPGVVGIQFPFSEHLTQQNGYIHAGILTTVVDSACGYAAYTLTPVGTGILSVEFKVNLLAPARGVSFLATGRVIKAGRTLTICEGQVEAIDERGNRSLVAVMLATMIFRAK
jgi:uncharacterized protein (TIGR00369 family)